MVIRILTICSKRCNNFLALQFFVCGLSNSQRAAISVARPVRRYVSEIIGSSSLAVLPWQFFHVSSSLVVLLSLLQPSELLKSFSMITDFS